jgi:hypothetical protein
VPIVADRDVIKAANGEISPSSEAVDLVASTRTPKIKRCNGINRRPNIKRMPVAAIKMTIGHPQTIPLMGSLTAEITDSIRQLNLS